MLIIYSSMKKIIIIAGVAVVLVALIFGVWKWAASKKINSHQSTIEYKEISKENKQEISAWQKYKNDKYKYEISYSNDWHIFTEEADSDFSELELDRVGGAGSDCGGPGSDCGGAGSHCGGAGSHCGGAGSDCGGAGSD